MKKIFQKKRSGFTILELLVAMTMLAIVGLAVSVTIGQIYLNQRTVNLRQDFHNEARLLMERMVQLVRNNTIDYDRYFIDIGPNPSGSALADCVEFDESQVPEGTPEAERQNNPLGDFLGPGHEVGRANREALGYESIFYWDTNGDGEQDRNLGGKLPSDDYYSTDFGTEVDDDGCVEALDASNGFVLFHTGLYLINAERTVRTSIGWDRNGTYGAGDTEDDKVVSSVEYGTDTDGDKKIDVWSSEASWNNSLPTGEKCRLEDDLGSDLGPVFGQPLNDNEARRFCGRAYAPLSITPDSAHVEYLRFTPTPIADPFLAFRRSEYQIHPHVYIDLRMTIQNPEASGFGGSTPPNTRLTTSASSRVFGNSR